MDCSIDTTDELVVQSCNTTSTRNEQRSRPQDLSGCTTMFAQPSPLVFFDYPLLARIMLRKTEIYMNACPENLSCVAYIAWTGQISQFCKPSDRNRKVI